MIKDRVTTKENCPPSAVRLFTCNRFVNEYNNDKFDKLNFMDKTEIKALDSVPGDLPQSVKNKILRSVKNEDEYKLNDTYGLPTILKVGINLQYDITVNIDTQDGLTNGASCILKHIDRRQQNLTNNMPSILWIQLPEEEMGANMRKTYKNLYTRNIKKTWTPIMVISRNFFYQGQNKNITVTRIQFPLTLSSAKTIHKSQGSTLEEVVVDMSGTVQKHCHYVAFSRVTKVTGLYITNLSPEKITIEEKNISIMEELRQYNPIKLSYTPIYTTKQKNPNDLLISFLNARSLHLHYQDFKVDNNFTCADIMFFAETRLKQTDTNEQFTLDEYTIFRNDQKPKASERPHHGILAYIKNNIRITKQNKFSSDSIEWIFIEVCHNNTIIQIISLYKTPSTNQSCLLETLRHIKSFINKKNKLVIIGDFNIDISDKKSTITNFMKRNFNTNQIIQHYTTKNQTTIDLIFTNTKQHNSGTIYMPWTDHRLIWINI